MNQHLPVLAVMTLFLGAFLTEVLGSKNKIIRNTIVFIAVTAAFVMLASLIPTVLFGGQTLSYWMGGWEPVDNYAIGIGYEVDALGLTFALLGITAYWLSMLYSFDYMDGKPHLAHYYTLFLMLAGSSIGFFLTGDIFNMFIMMEIVTFSAVSLTASNNEKETAIEGAFKYLVNCSVGSSITLAGIAMLYMSCHTLNLAQLASILPGNMNFTTIMAFGLIIAGYSVESAMIPFHASFADAHTVAPSSISMILSGMVLKVGVYGIIRMTYIVFRAIDLPQIEVLLTLMGTITMFVGVTMALAQHDFKRLLAFHSISQIGYIIAAAGLCTTLGLTGGIYHAINHTLFKGLLFLCAGAVLHMTGTSNLDSLGGLSKRMPHTTVCFLIGAFSISGLPPFNGFVSKWIIYQAAYTKAVETGNFWFLIVTVAALICSVMTLASFVKVTHSVFFGQLRAVHKDVKEAPKCMVAAMYILAALCVATGLFYDRFNSSVIAPAVKAAFSNTAYIDNMMGQGYAAMGSVAAVIADKLSFSFWNPFVWLVLFLMMFAAAAAVILGGSSSRGAIEASDDPADARYDVFFSGEKAEYSHAGGSDMFWGFKFDWRRYYEFMEGLHTGSVNDYTIYSVTAIALIVLFMFIFMR